MKIDFSTKQIIRAFSHFMHRYHVILFAVFVVGGLSVATLLLYRAATSPTSSSSKDIASSFDKTTINKINGLRGAGDTPAPLHLPPGRTNPFQN